MDPIGDAPARDDRVAVVHGGQRGRHVHDRPGRSRGRLLRSVLAPGRAVPPIARLDPQPMATFTQPTRGASDVDRVDIVFCAPRRSDPSEPSGAARQRCDERVDLDTDHSPMISAVDELADGHRRSLAPNPRRLTMTGMVERCSSDGTTRMGRDRTRPRPMGPEALPRWASQCLLAGRSSTSTTIPAWQIARLTVELTRPVPIGMSLTCTHIERPGRKVSLVAAVLLDGDVEVARARSLRIRTLDVELPADTVQPAADPPGRRVRDARSSRLGDRPRHRLPHPRL